MAHKENLKELTGRTYYEAVVDLVDKMEVRFGDLSDPATNTEVLAIARGGLIPATYAVYRLGCPLNILYLRSYAKPEVQIKEVEAYGILPFRSAPDLPKRVLVIDDIQDTGNSFNFVKRYFSEEFGIPDKQSTELVFCAVVHRDREDTEKPDIHGVLLNGTAWVNFPYEPPDAPLGR